MEELQSQLSGLDLPELRKKAAKEYGVKPLPEWTKADVINAILAKASGATKYVTDTSPLEEKGSKYGWSRIKVVRGRDNVINTHAQASLNGYQFSIPYGLEVNIPTIVADFLSRKKSPVPKQDPGENLVRIEYEDRWIVQFLEKNYGPNGEEDYIPKSERAKFWNDQREAKLKKKRDFLEQMGFWPTDRDLKRHMDSGYFNAVRRGNA